MMHGLSQTQLGCILGISKPAISDIERGRRGTTIEKLVEIADCFNISLDYLVGRSNCPDLIIKDKEGNFVVVETMTPPQRQ